MTEKLKELKAKFDAMPLSGKIVAVTALVLVLSAVGLL